DSALFVRLVLGLNHRPVTVDDFLDRDTLACREGQLPVTAGLHGVHKLVGDQQAQVELTQTAIFTLGFDELFYVRMADIERTHLCTTPATGRANGEAHLVKDVHEGQGTIGAGASTRDVRATVAQRREFVTDTATGLQGQARIVNRREDLRDGVTDGAGDGAVDQRNSGLVIARTGVRGDATGRDCTILQSPEENRIVVVRVGFDVSEGACNALVGILHGLVDRIPLRV